MKIRRRNKRVWRPAPLQTRSWPQVSGASEAQDTHRGWSGIVLS